MLRCLVATLILMAGLAGYAGSPMPSAPPPPHKWEEAGRSDMPPALLPVKGAEDARTGIKEGYLYIDVKRPTQVKLFTILGQPIASESIPAGVHRIRITSRGIYLLRIGNITVRVKI